MYNVFFKNQMYTGSFVHCTSYDDSNDFEYLIIVVHSAFATKGRDGGDERGETEAITRRRRRRQQREMNLMYMCIVVHVDGKKICVHSLLLYMRTVVQYDTSYLFVFI